MLKKKRSEDDLVNFYCSCVLFKKYYQYNLWFGNFGEYYNIKYCKKYIQKYIYYWIHIFLLQYFNLSFVIFLYKSPCFTKYVESGFFKYLDYYFLLSFYNNCFTFNVRGKEKIKIFIKLYFNFFFKKRIKKDLLVLVNKVMNEVILNVLVKYLVNRLKYIQINVERVWLNDKTLSKLVTVKNKKKIYFIGLFYFNYLIKNNYYRFFFNNLSNLYILNFYYSFKSLKLVYKSLLKSINLRSVKVDKFIMEKKFIEFPRKTLYRSNKDVQHLVEFVEFLGGFYSQEKNIGLYINSNILFEDFLGKNSFRSNKSFKTLKKQSKSFNFCFVKYKYKRKFYLKSITSNNLDFFNIKKANN